MTLHEGQQYGNFLPVPWPAATVLEKYCQLVRGPDGWDPLNSFHALCSDQNREPICILGKCKAVIFPWKNLLQFQHN